MEIRESARVLAAGIRRLPRSFTGGLREGLLVTANLDFEEINKRTMAHVIQEQISRVYNRNNPFDAEIIYRNIRVIPNKDYPTSGNRNVIIRRIEDSLRELVEMKALRDLDANVPESPLLRRYDIADRELLGEAAKGEITVKPESA